jgi:hypothetical protein
VGGSEWRGGGGGARAWVGTTIRQPLDNDRQQLDNCRVYVDMCVRGRLLGSLLQGICGIGTSCLVYVDVAEAVWHMLICVVPFLFEKAHG